MTKRKDDGLKERLTALRVHEPLKLRKDGVVLKAPSDRVEVTHVEVPRFHPARTEDAQFEVPQKEVNLSKSGKPNEVPSLNSEAARVEAPYVQPPRNEGAHFEPAQSEVGSISTLNVPRFEQPHSEAAQVDTVSKRRAGGQSGFFKLSHNVFSEPLLQKLSGDCFRLFLWLSSKAWRYPSSDGLIRAAVRFIEDETGISHANISRSLKALKEAGLISLSETDFKRGNVWRISRLAVGTPGPDGWLPQKEATNTEVPSSEERATSKRERSNPSLRAEAPQIERNINNKKNNPKNSEKAAVAFSTQQTTPPENDRVDFEQALAIFLAALSEDEQKQVVTHFLEKECPQGIRPPAKILQKLAASDWYRGTQCEISAVSVGRG